MLWRARSGYLGGAVTAAATALVVLGLTSFLLAYPTESVRMVDAGVRNVTGMIAAGFSDGKVMPEGGTSEDQAADAIDAQMDDIIRDTQYRTWANGVFGDPDTAVARKYGPRVFRSTHFSWAEYAAYRSDPNGDGKKILEAKQKAFKEYADAIKRADPVAYESFTGKKWNKRVTSALVNLFVICIPCLFLLLAGLFAVMGFVVIRLVVPLAPAAGVIFMFDKTRDIAVGWLKRVVGPLVMGPVCLVVALVLLRFTSAIFEVDEMWFVLKLGLIAVLTLIAFRLSGVMGMVPGVEPIRRRIRTALVQAVGTATGAAAGTHEGLRHNGDAAPPSPPSMETSPGGVYHPAFAARVPSAPRALEPVEGFLPYVHPPKPLGAGEQPPGELGSSTPTTHVVSATDVAAAAVGGRKPDTTVLRPSIRRPGDPAAFGTSTRKTYRRTFDDYHPEYEDRHKVVHHAVEQVVLSKYPGVVTPEEMHSIENLRGIPAEVNSEVHLSEIRKMWNRFYKEHRRQGAPPTKQDLLDFATHVDQTLGQHFIPPEATDEQLPD